MCLLRSIMSMEQLGLPAEAASILIIGIFPIVAPSLYIPNGKNIGIGKKPWERRSLVVCVVVIKLCPTHLCPSWWLVRVVGVPCEDKHPVQLRAFGEMEWRSISSNEVVDHQT